MNLAPAPDVPIATAVADAIAASLAGDTTACLANRPGIVAAVRALAEGTNRAPGGWEFWGWRDRQAWRIRVVR